MRILRISIITLIKILTGYYIVSLVFYFALKYLKPRSTQKLYLKETIHLDLSKLNRIRIASQVVFSLIGLFLISFILFYNFAPFGMTVEYTLNDTKRNISQLGPKERVLKQNTKEGIVYKQIDDVLYFTTHMPFHFDKAQVTVVYKNDNEDQQILLGFKDQDYEWHYNTQYIDLPVLDKVSWGRIGDNPVLYEREKKYNSFKDFLSNPPRDGIIGTYNFDISTLKIFNTTLSDYKSKYTNTLIDVPLRGKHTLYAYLKNEPFIMKFTKKDLNWYKGEDIVTIDIIKDGNRVHQNTILDDGIIDDSKQSMPEQTLEVRNPGPGLPETGIYKIVINAPDDTIIEKIETNLHKIVFEGPIYPVSKSTIYPTLNSSQSATTLVTNSVAISAETYHKQSNQTILIDKLPFVINTINVEINFATTNAFSTILIPKNDLIIDGLLGYFSLNQDQFFLPSPYFVMAIKSPEDIDLVDYIISDYSPPHKENGWSISTSSFDLSTAVLNGDQLSWILRAPGLKRSKGLVEIKDINVTFSKKPLVLNKK